MAKGGEQQDDLDVSIRWPKGYYDDDDPAPPRRRRKSAGTKEPGARRARTPVTAPVATTDEPIVVPPVAEAEGVEEVGLGHDDEEVSRQVDRLSEQLSGVTEQITEALLASSKAVRRVEQLTAALSVEVAEIGQAITDQVAGYSASTTDEVRTGTRSMKTEVKRIDKSVTDSLTTINQQLEGLAAAVADTYDRPAGASSEGFEELVEGTSEAVTRVETLVEALVEASDARPADISEHSARTLERLGLTVGARFEANTTTAVEAIDVAVNEALERAVAQFKEMAPPPVDRSTTAAITRLEDRVAELTRQRDEHDKETKATLNGLEETVGRLASAQAEDLERILDTIEGVTPPAPPTDRPEAARLARIEKSLATLTDASQAPSDLGDVAEQFDTVNKQLAALRRRLPVRGRQGGTGIDDRSLSELAALVAERIQAPEVARPARAARPPRATRSVVRATKSSSAKATPSRVRRRPPGE
jgi:uncharacterized protein YoxC